MDAELFKAAADGNFEPFIKKTQHLSLDQIVTKFKDTILHINIKNGPSTKFVELVLKKCPDLLRQVNDKGDTPLIVAAKWGHTVIVGVLIKRAKAEHKYIAATEMLRMKNREGNTALHEAARKSCYQVVKLLTKEDPDNPNLTNNKSQTPLHIAVSRGNLSVVDHILKLTAPHATTMTDNQSILQKKKDLTKDLADQNGWTPLHFAAYYGYFDAAKLLLKFNESAAYIGDKDRNMTALHLAASQGHVRIIKEIISRCPDCYDLIDKRGWNVLHFAMVSLSVTQLKRLLLNSLLSSLINEKDSKGNTPLYVLAAVSDPSSFLEVMRGVRFDWYTPLHLLAAVSDPSSLWDVMRRVRCDWCKGLLDHVIPALKQEILELSEDMGGGLYPQGVIRTREGTKEKEKNRINNVKQSQMIVATLVAAATFAAAFRVPGGYKNNGGSGKGKDQAFRTFFLVDFAAFFFSVTAVICNFLLSFDMFANAIVIYVISLASFYTTCALASMAIAFLAGILAVTPYSE